MYVSVLMSLHVEGTGISSLPLMIILDMIIFTLGIENSKPSHVMISKDV